MLTKWLARAKLNAKALGATVVDYSSPSSAGAFRRLDHGAVVTKLEHGPLQDLGLAEHYVVLAVDGHDVPDAATFAKIVADDYERCRPRIAADRSTCCPDRERRPARLLDPARGEAHRRPASEHNGSGTHTTDHSTA